MTDYKMLCKNTTRTSHKYVQFPLHVEKFPKENKKIVDHLVLSTSEDQVGVGCFSEHGEPD